MSFELPSAEVLLTAKNSPLLKDWFHKHIDSMIEHHETQLQQWKVLKSQFQEKAVSCAHISPRSTVPSALNKSIIQESKNVGFNLHEENGEVQSPASASFPTSSPSASPTTHPDDSPTQLVHATRPKVKVGSRRKSAARTQFQSTNTPEHSPEPGSEVSEVSDAMDDTKYEGIPTPVTTPGVVRMPSKQPQLNSSAVFNFTAPNSPYSSIPPTPTFASSSMQARPPIHTPGAATPPHIPLHLLSGISGASTPFQSSIAPSPAQSSPGSPSHKPRPPPLPPRTNSFSSNNNNGNSLSHSPSQSPATNENGPSFISLGSKEFSESTMDFDASGTEFETTQKTPPVPARPQRLGSMTPSAANASNNVSTTASNTPPVIPPPRPPKIAAQDLHAGLTGGVRLFGSDSTNNELFAKLRKKREETAKDSPSSSPTSDPRQGSPNSSSSSPLPPTSQPPSVGIVHPTASPPTIARIPSTRTPPPPPPPQSALPPCTQCGCTDFKANAFRNKDCCTNCFHVHT